MERGANRGGARVEACRAGAADLDRFCQEWYRRLNTDNRGGPLIYHYTGPRGLLGILTGASLRATNIAFLNDSAEYLLALERIGAALSRFERRAADLARFVEGMDVRLRAAREQVPPVYVVSFSRAADLLSQWRGYGEEESGYAVGFDIEALGQALNRTGAVLAPCVYGADQQDAFADDLVRTIADLWASAGQGADGGRAAAMLDEAFSRLAWFAALFKHPGFSEEQEWRVIRLLDPNELDDLVFFSRETCIATALPIRFDRSMLREVWVGPSRHQNLSIPALVALLRQQDYPGDARVIPSSVPYRLV